MSDTLRDPDESPEHRDPDAEAEVLAATGGAIVPPGVPGGHASSASGGYGTGSENQSSGGTGEGTDETSTAGDDAQTEWLRDAPGAGGDR